ncbi:MAG: ThuA domain-containing protein [Flavihumibacter sp.]
MNTRRFSDNKIGSFQAIILLNTTGTIFDSPGRKALQDYVHAGGGVVGIHAATDCEPEWPWYNRFMGAQFDSHPEQQVASLHKTALKHPATALLPDSWSRKDEWYNFKNFNNEVKVLLTLDESSYKGGTMNGYHPMAWYQDFECGKMFYTALGHTNESCSEPLLLQHAEAGIKSVLK